MPWGDETYKALQSGSLDGLMLNVDSGYALNAQRFAPDVLVSRDLWLGHVYLLVMNKNTWDNLSRDDRAAIQRAADVAYQSLGSVMDKSFTTQVADLEKAVRRSESCTLKTLRNGKPPPDTRRFSLSG